MPSPYADLDRPPLSAARLARDLARDGAWREVRVLDETPSTNAVVAAEARAGAAEGLVVVTEHQTAGRGRLGRPWDSPPRAGLTFSVLLCPTVPAAAWSWVPLLAGLAVGDALAGVARIDAVLKWPNDVLVPDGGKLAGILAERAGTAIALGVGLNVTTDAAELPAGATSLRLAGAATTDREPLLKAILRALDGRYAAWLAGAVPAADYRRRCATIGRRVRVELPDGGAITGQAADVDEHGRLVLREDAGARHELSAGDVVHLRAGSADPC